MGDLVEHLNKSGALQDLPPALQTALFLGGLVLLPTLLVCITGFTRIVIVLSFVRRAVTSQDIPPNLVVLGLSFFLTWFVMGTTLEEINEQAVTPYLDGKMPVPVAVQKATDSLRKFMLAQTRRQDLALFAFGRRDDRLVDALVAAALGHALEDRVRLAARLHEELRLALRARLVDRPLPQLEVALDVGVAVVGAAVERPAAALRAHFDDLAAALRARDLERDVPRALALGVRGAAEEEPVAAPALHHGRVHLRVAGARVCVAGEDRDVGHADAHRAGDA